MSKGQIAKSKIAEKLKEAFGSNFLGEMNGKYYIEEDDGGEKVQVAINMTCPKVLFEKELADTETSMPRPTSAFGVGSASHLAAQTQPAAEISAKEKENIRTLMERLGL